SEEELNRLVGDRLRVHVLADAKREQWPKLCQVVGNDPLLLGDAAPILTGACLSVDGCDEGGPGPRKLGPFDGAAQREIDEAGDTANARAECGPRRLRQGEIGMAQASEEAIDHAGTRAD